jgi:hypothetical protein
MLLNYVPRYHELVSSLDSIPFEPLEVNGHFHTPYSFSAFTGMDQVFEMARQEGLQVLGINDFYVADGYEEFASFALSNRIFPLFNIEFIALNKSFQEQGIRVNDPNNPGRTYFSGKGLNAPLSLPADAAALLEKVKTESQRQVAQMIEKLNVWLASLGSDIVLSYEGVRTAYARQLVRERHIAKALRIAIFERYTDDGARLDFLKRLYGGKDCAVSLSNEAALDNELRNNLLKSGGRAFVEEDDQAFLSVEQVWALILQAGGIPCYPVLLDDKNGNYTDYEGNKEQMLADLIQRKIFSIELIPGRNSLEALTEFVRFFRQNGFVITFGTEHNAPDMIPLTCDSRGKVALTEELRRINYEGACVVAAHQYLHAQGMPGFVDAAGDASRNQMAHFIRLGNAVIRKFSALS